jgi:hypothetical protein
MSKPIAKTRQPPHAAEDPQEVERRFDGRRSLLAYLRRLRGFLRRPLGLRRRGWQWDIVFVERRRNPPHYGLELANICAELRIRLAALDREHVMKSMRALVRVYEELKRRGWPGVEAMSARRLERAARQARALYDLEPSAALARLADRLRLIQAAAEAREERARAARREDAAAKPEVVETDFSEFERLDSVPPRADLQGAKPAEVPATEPAGGPGGEAQHDAPAAAPRPGA